MPGNKSVDARLRFATFFQKSGDKAINEREEDKVKITKVTVGTAGETPPILRNILPDDFVNPGDQVSYDSLRQHYHQTNYY